MSKKFGLLVIVIVMLSLLAACGSGKNSKAPASDPTPGVFIGTTSQGMDFILEVGNTPDGLAVTSVKYKVKVTGDGFSATIDYVQALECKMLVENGRFSGEVNLHGEDAPAQFSGAFFNDNRVEGRFKQVKVHPQGYGEATADVTFSADRSE